METPSSSTRRITRSQTSAAVNNIPISRRIEDAEKGVSKSRQRATKQQQDRSALIDITNDSPIVGLATGVLEETPSSAVAKRRTIRAKNNTPGSGEALLRCQAKTLLQKVEEEAELSKISLESRPFLHLQGFVNSPMRLHAPTPANTPQVLNLSEDANNDNDLASINASPVTQEQLISLVVGEIKIEEGIESDINTISRSLLLDFSEKTESTECSSVETDAGKSDGKEKSYPDEDDSSVWSIQVNASIHDEEEEVDESYNDNYEENEAEEYDEVLLDELCEELSKISVNNTEQTMAKFTGRHTRYLYNSDDEIVEEELSKISVNNTEQTMAKFTGRHTRYLYNSDDEIVEEELTVNNNNLSIGFSPNVLSLKGLPTPKGKHIRFAIEEEEIVD